MITIENKRLHDLIALKDVEVAGGRKISQEIEKDETKIKRFEEKEKRITGKVIPPKEMIEKGNNLIKEMKAIEAEVVKISDEINKIKLDAIPKEMREDHMAVLKHKENLERERNKVALKVQKIKDKIIPMVQKFVKPMLAEYDDIETAYAKDGKVLITTFNHLDDFKAKFRR